MTFLNPWKTQIRYWILFSVILLLLGPTNPKGFSFSGEVREPFPAVIESMKKSKLPVTAVDIPSSWDVDNGPPAEGPGKGFIPDVLVSLTAPKPCATKFNGRHFVGGRFLSKAMADKYGVELPPFQGVDQIVELTAAEKL
jgi:NAD(P)H-hydrate epimerase